MTTATGTTKRGSELVVGDCLDGMRITAIEPYQVPAAVLHDSVAAQHPRGLPGYVVTLNGSRRLTVFADDACEVSL